MLPEDVSSCLRIWHVGLRGRFDDLKAFADWLEEQMQHLITIIAGAVGGVFTALVPMVVFLRSAMFLVSLLILTAPVRVSRLRLWSVRTFHAVAMAVAQSSLSMSFWFARGLAMSRRRRRS